MSIRAHAYVAKWAPKCELGPKEGLFFNNTVIEHEAELDWNQMSAEDRTECHKLWGEEEKRYTKPQTGHITGVTWDVVRFDGYVGKHKGRVFYNGDIFFESQPKSTPAEAERSARSMARQAKKNIKKAIRRLTT